MDLFLRTLRIHFVIFPVDLLMIYATETFEKCSPGYHWPACIVPCRYPNYGNDCQSECSSCTEEHCNYIIGCTKINVTDTMAVKDNQHILYYSTSGTTVHNTSEEGERTQGMPPSCQSTSKPYGIQTMVISLCILTSALFVIIGVYLKLNKMNYFQLQYIQDYGEQNDNLRTENSIL